MSYWKKLKNFIASDLGYFVVLTTLLLALSISPQIKRQLDTPIGRVFNGLEFYSDDYSIYVSNIFQGQRGRWTLLDKHTSEPHQGTIIHDEYLLWGKFTNLFQVDPITSYHLARYTFGFLLLVMVWLFLKQIFPTTLSLRDPPDGRSWQSKQRIDSHVPLGPRNDNFTLRKLAFFLITFSTGFIIIKNSPTGLSFDFHMNWLTEMDVFYRFVALPHYLLGNIFFLGALICFLKYLSHLSILSHLGNLQYLFFGSLCALLLALIHPVALVSLLALLAIFNLFAFTIIRLVSLPNLPNSPKSLIFSREFTFLFACLLASAPIMLFYRYQFGIPPWNHMAAWEGVTQYHVPFLEFGYAIGPTFFLGIIGMIALLINMQRKTGDGESVVRGFFSLFSKKTPPATGTPAGPVLFRLRVFILLLSWILSFFLLVYFSYPFLHISQIRFMQVFIFVPFGILAAEGIIFLCRLFHRLLRLPPPITLISLISLILLLALPYYFASLRLKYNFFTDFSPLVYPHQETVDSYFWLRDHTNPEDVVIGAFLAGTQIPFFSNNTVYTGHLWATLNREKKEPLVSRFLRNEMTNDEAQTFFKENRIKYFYDGWQEASYGFNINHYPFLKPVFKNKMVTIYKSKP